MKHGFFLSIFLLAGCGASTVAPPEKDAGRPPDAVDGSRPDVQPAEASHLDSGSSPDVSSSDAQSSDADASVVCNSLTNIAPVVDVTQMAADPPSPEGGMIANGTYAMTAVTIYTGPEGPTGASGTAQTTIEVTGDTIQMVGSGQPLTRTVTLVTSGVTFTATDSCPDTQVSQGGYTATPTTLTVFLPGGTDDAGARTVAESFTKQ
jgi:hypothetical protein